MSKRRAIGNLLAGAFVLTCVCPLVFAKVTPEEAKAIGTTLTSFGAEAGANADGSIPAYTGGLQTVPGYNREKNQTYIDPYKSEKPLYSVTAKNMAQYDAVLTEGSKALLKKYPDTYRIDVFPTHRTMRIPDWMVENTKKNATTAEMTGQETGDSLKGAAADGLPFQGVPFPIPKNGYEVMWNHKMTVGPAVLHQQNKAFLVDSNGSVTDIPSTHQMFTRPWSEQTGELRKKTFDATYGVSSNLVSPPSAAGTFFLNFYLPTADNGGQRVWFYTPGQRRTRTAPDFSYDLPIAAYGGALFWDELTGFVGRMDRFDFKLIGKKEMVIPYNSFPLTQDIQAKDALGKSHLNPEAVRFEKHRVWVVEADRKAGERHAYKKRRFYVEEDCNCVVASDAYDDAGNLWRVGAVYTFPTYDVGGVNNMSVGFNDLLKGNYFIMNYGAADEGYFNRSYTSADGLQIKLTPASLAGSVR
ncbi:DUF1329 domain-containing protein [Pseudomonas sp.]|uniref:DUF1329 domain-containing protein n=1 Tax=Pseudomonas sp. TaxID=306 RepID=UPI002615A7C4|nr:DUF1329 domain-containing protein [Pseudomonas sp.]